VFFDVQTGWSFAESRFGCAEAVLSDGLPPVSQIKE
jgi:hypothetical protein